MTPVAKPKLQNGWSPLIVQTLAGDIGQWLLDIYKNPEVKCIPDKENVFRAFKLCPLEKVKVVIIGQDPYPGADIKASMVSTEPIITPKADGLAFSTKSGSIPPTLKTIFAAIKADIGIENKNPDLSGWANQGVLLLNSSLTIELTGTSHKKVWKPFIKSVIDEIDKLTTPVVFILWGSEAKKFSRYIDGRYRVLMWGHPSPSAKVNFIACRHFSQANEFLSANGVKPIDWSTDNEPS